MKLNQYKVNIMKKLYILLGIFLSIFWLLNSVNAQVQEAWKRDLKQDILWQQVTPLGNLVITTPAALTGIDPATGAELWSRKDFGGLERTAAEQIKGSPLLTINRKGVISILEPFHGMELFNSQAAGIATIDTSFFLYLNNGILIAGKKPGSKDPVMIMVNMNDGKISWKIEEKFGNIIAVQEISGTEILVVTLFNNYRIKSTNGKIIWKNKTSAETGELDNMGALGGALKAFAEEATKNVQFNMRFYHPDNSDVFYLGSQQESKSTMSSSSTTASVTYTNKYYAYSLSDGSLAWNDPLEMKGKLGQVAFDPLGMIVLPDDGNRTLINMVDYKTHEGKWGKKGKGIPIKGGVYDYFHTEKGYVLVTRSGEKNFVNFLDPDQGLLIFEEPLRISGTVVGIIPVTKGILLITTSEMNIMDPATGKFILPESIATKPELTVKQDDFIIAFDVKEKKVVSLDCEKAVVKIITPSPIAFEGKETPNRLELREKGILLSSDQNVSLISQDGVTVYKKYYAAPREPGLKRALLYAQAVRAAYIGANAYYGAAAFQSAAPKASDPVAGAIYQGVGEAYEQLGNAAADFTKASFQQANKRFKATASGRDFLIILTQTDKVIELVKVNKNTGEIDGRVDLGKERSPEYAVDDVTGQIFLRSAPTSVASYKF